MKTFFLIPEYLSKYLFLSLTVLSQNGPQLLIHIRDNRFPLYAFLLVIINYDEFFVVFVISILVIFL